MLEDREAWEPGEIGGKPAALLVQVGTRKENTQK